MSDTPRPRDADTSKKVYPPPPNTWKIPCFLCFLFYWKLPLPRVLRMKAVRKPFFSVLIIYFAVSNRNAIKLFRKFTLWLETAAVSTSCKSGKKII